MRCAVCVVVSALSATVSPCCLRVPQCATDPPSLIVGVARSPNHAVQAQRPYARSAFFTWCPPAGRASPVHVRRRWCAGRKSVCLASQCTAGQCEMVRCASCGCVPSLRAAVLSPWLVGHASPVRLCQRKEPNQAAAAFFHKRCPEGHNLIRLFDYGGSSATVIVAFRGWSCQVQNGSNC